MKHFSKKTIKAEIPERPRYKYDREPYDQAEERGKKEVSQYDEEYEFLIKLIKLISKAAPESVPEIKALSQSFPFVTIDDVGDLAAKIWTLATEKYNIPRDWLIEKLDKHANLMKKADLWPAQEQAGDMLSHEHNSLSYNNEQEADTSVSGPRPDEVDKVSKSKKLNINDVVKILNAKEPQVANINTKERTLQLIDGTVLSFDDAIKKAMEMEKTGLFSGAEFSTTEFNVNPTLDNGPFSSPQDEGATDQIQPWPNTEWVPADDKNEDEEPYSDIASNLKRPFSKKADLSGQVVNTILNDIHSSGTATYNMIDGDMQGTHNFAVSAYPERTQSSPEGVDFDVIEKYLLTNEDLLKDSNNAFRAVMQNGQVQLQVVATVPDRDQAIQFAREHNQPTISDLMSNQDISTNASGDVNKTAEESILSQEDQDEIAAATSPVYNIALNNYAEAVKRGHSKDRAIAYAVESVKNIEKIDEKTLVGLINNYLTI